MGAERLLRELPARITAGLGSAFNLTWPACIVALLGWSVLASAQSDATADLIEAAARGEPSQLAALLARGADVELRQSREVPLTLLMIAVRAGRADLVRVLLDHGADIDAVAPQYGSPLSACARGEHPEIMQMLLEAGADPNRPAADGTTPLMIAALYGHAEMVERLLQAGANPALRNRYDQTALSMALNAGVDTAVCESNSAVAHPASLPLMPGYLETAILLYQATHPVI